MHLRGANAGGRSLFDRKDDRVLQKFTGAGDHNSNRSRHAASVEERNSRQNVYSRADRQLLLRRMPVHENEHAGESLRRAAQHGTGDHITGTDPQTRRVADSANARTEPVGRGGSPEPPAGANPARIVARAVRPAASFASGASKNPSN